MLMKTSSCELPIGPSQAELMERFNLAFYEGATRTELTTETPDLLDYLIGPEAAPAAPEETFFDFTDFVKTFDENLSSGAEDFGYYVPPPPLFQTLDLSDIELNDALSSSSLDLDSLSADLCDLDEDRALPPISTIASRSTIDFGNFLRGVPCHDLNFGAQNRPEDGSRGDFGHLVGTRRLNNNYVPMEAEALPPNQTILPQNEALLHDDPLLSASSALYYPVGRRRHPQVSESDEESSSPLNLQCQWDGCYEICDSQASLVRHIEKGHVEVKRGDEFTCFWANCPRKVKPFNARYKLLIHMRVHSGEKPNKCPFEGCNKAFSRLENLKIHQRSHTGERPYLCQFPTCSKSFSNSSDRAKHQRTHFDTKPYACQVMGCSKKYTDPSSLRKHVKNHSSEEQQLLKRRPSQSEEAPFSTAFARRFFDPNRQKALKSEPQRSSPSAEHNYHCGAQEIKKYDSNHIRQDLKNKISEKNKMRKVVMASSYS